VLQDALEQATQMLESTTGTEVNFAPCPTLQSHHALRTSLRRCAHNPFAFPKNTQNAHQIYARTPKLTRKQGIEFFTWCTVWILVLFYLLYGIRPTNARPRVTNSNTLLSQILQPLGRPPVGFFDGAAWLPAHAAVCLRAFILDLDLHIPVELRFWQLGLIIIISS
jgi:hypothetical protein